MYPELIGLGAAASIGWVIWRKRKKTLNAPSAQLPEAQGEEHHIVWGQEAFLKAYSEINVEGLPHDEACIVRHGRQAEQNLMDTLYKVPGGVVFWNVGLDVGGTRCEIDQILLCPEGLVLIECKSLRGVWVATDKSRVRPDTWVRVDHYQKTIKSPFFQIARTGGILVRLLKELGLYIPVSRILVFVGQGVEVPDAEDDRATVCFIEGARHGIEQCREELKAKPAPKPEHLALFMAFLAKEGVLPAFFDRRILLHLLEDENALSVDAWALLHALFSQTPSPGFCNLPAACRPKVVLQESFRPTMVQILSALGNDRVLEELKRPPSGMVWDPVAVFGS